MKTRCQLCNRRVADEWRAKWSHMVMKHPEIVAARLLPYVCNPEAAREIGRSAAESIIKRVLHG